ncbi:MAG: cytochrome C oxidase subunit II, partial [Deltaproteobacteria bacterium]|nr:cytochrome C oxidase subunit II [Deltaproteobacteria bacterium]
MARETIVKSPNLVHPEKPSAVGSRNSLHRQDRDEYEEAKGIIDEEVDKILNHIHAKLPPEVLEKLDVMGSVKSKLHNYFNQDFQNMLNRYLVTMEDEMNKKIRD